MKCPTSLPFQGFPVHDELNASRSQRTQDRVLIAPEWMFAGFLVTGKSGGSAGAWNPSLGVPRAAVVHWAGMTHPSSMLRKLQMQFYGWWHWDVDRALQTPEFMRCAPPCCSRAPLAQLTHAHHPRLQVLRAATSQVQVPCTRSWPCTVCARPSARPEERLRRAPAASAAVWPRGRVAATLVRQQSRQQGPALRHGALLALGTLRDPRLRAAQRRAVLANAHR